MCSPALRQKIEDAVNAKIEAGEPFTSACISHPLIAADSDVRHYEVSNEIRRMWRDSDMPSNFIRSSVTVWPNGPGRQTATAWLYHLDDYDPSNFNGEKKVLVRGGVASVVVPAADLGDGLDDADDTVAIVNTADGSAVSRPCSVQKSDLTLNVPRFLIKSLAWKTNDSVSVEKDGTTITIKRDAAGKQKVDAEGRIRVHGNVIDVLTTKTPTAWIAEPATGEKHIEISATVVSKSDAADASDSDAAPPVTDDAAVSGPASVWKS